MRYSAKYTVAASLVVGAAASHQHGHHHFHAKKSSPVEMREPDVVTQWVAGPTETVYELDGELVNADEAAKGIDGGEFIVVGETMPTYVPPPPPPPPEPTTSSEPEMGAKFIEESAEPPKPKETTPPKPPPPPPKKPVGGSIDSDFPDDTIPCSEFPSEYGAQPLSWLGMNGWAGLQYVPGYAPGASSIVDIITGIVGSDCTEGCMCSYACPDGYQKLQWPDAQGSTKESIGGLFCNSKGKLERTSKETKLCGKGAGGVSIKNELDEVVNTCRTDYPGTESMVIPSTANPGQTIELTNPLQDYYIWDGMETSAQYYLNKKGYSVEDACVWDSPKDPEGAGNWSPVIIGVGKSADGTTYLSIFQNLPTSHAKLDFNVEITGDVTIECSYKNGVWSQGGSGCTTGMSDGGSAVFRFF